MNFFGEVFNKLGIIEIAPTDFRVSVYGDYIAYFENVNGIKSVERDKIEIFTKKGVITVTGENLSIEKFTLLDMVVTGKIKTFGVEK